MWLLCMINVHVMLNRWPKLDPSCVTAFGDTLTFVFVPELKPSYEDGNWCMKRYMFCGVRLLKYTLPLCEANVARKDIFRSYHIYK